ncbi:MAG: GNAT family N-acetyltransferase [Lachnospiraceae bacterium]|nr:GNAT family N-acetyltransferase [Lachnospiraceae bacterium]
MTIDQTARAQFRLDTNCPLEDEERLCVLIQERKDLDGARVYEGMSSFFRAILYKGDSYIMADPVILPWVRERYGYQKPEWFCKFENLRELDHKLSEYGYEIADTHIYLLPDEKAEDFEFETVPYEEEWFDPERIASFQEENPFPHALVYSRTQPDVIALALKDGDKYIAMAGASVDGKYLWQIGIDVLPEYGSHGLAVYLVTTLKQEILRRGFLPFYGTSESHALSMDVGIRSGFLPAWSEVFVRKAGDGRACMPGEGPGPSG